MFVPYVPSHSLKHLVLATTFVYLFAFFPLEKHEHSLPHLRKLQRLTILEYET